MTAKRTKPRKRPDAEMLTRARQRKGYSQQQIAIITGVALRHYQRVENGERPFSARSMRQGLAICMLLDIDMVCFRSGKQQPGPLKQDLVLWRSDHVYVDKQKACPLPTFFV